MILRPLLSIELQFVQDQVYSYIFSFIDNFLIICIGGSIFSGVNADLFITGEMGHHQVLELCDRQNAHVLLTEHSNCERGYLREVFTPLLSKTLNESLDMEFHVQFSEVDTHDPLSII